MKGNSWNTKTIVFGALGMALVYVATMFIKIPNPYQGYFNLGDGFILAFATVLNPFASFLVGGVGSALADLSGGYFFYILPTLIIKGLEGFMLSWAVHKVSKKAFLPAAFIASAWMVAGYFFAGWVLLGSAATAALDIPGNIAQAVAGLVVCLLCRPLLAKLSQELHLYTEN